MLPPRMARGARDAVLADVATEIVTLGSGGSGVRGGIEQALGRLDAPGPPVERQRRR